MEWIIKLYNRISKIFFFQILFLTSNILFKDNDMVNDLCFFTQQLVEANIYIVRL